MYKLVYFKCVNGIGFMHGLSRKTFELDLHKVKDKDMLIVVGDNAGGKSTFLSLIHPIHTPSDGRNKFIIPGKEGLLIRSYEGDDGTILVSKCIYTPKEDTHMAKCYLSIKKPGEDEYTELNPNGNVTSYNSLLMTYFGITKDYVNFAAYSDAVAGIVSMTDGERKANVSSLIPNTGRFEVAYNTINDKYKELRNLMRNVSQKIMAIRDEDSLDSDLKRITQELNRANIEREELIKKLGKAEGRVKELSHNQDIKQLVTNYNKMVTDLADYDARLMLIKRKLHVLYDKLNLEIDPNNDVMFEGISKIGSEISKYERKLSRADANIQTSSERIEKIYSDISQTEKDITETETTLFSIQTQDIKELERPKENYEDQLRSLHYTSVKEDYEDMDYNECVALIKSISTLSYMIQSLYDEYDDLVTQFFDHINENHTAEYHESIDKLTVSIETKTAKKDAIYRELIEKEQYRKFQDILDQRPRTCTDDSCPFIANALKWQHISGEISDLKEEYRKIDIEIANEQNQVNNFEKNIALQSQGMNVVTYINGIRDQLQKYLGVTVMEVYHSIAHGSWNKVLDTLKLKSIAAILSEKDLYNRITTILLPDVNHTIEIARVYGTNRSMLTTQIERMNRNLEMLQDEYNSLTISITASTKMREIYKNKLSYWRDIDSLLHEYQELLKLQVQTSETAEARSKEINTIMELINKCDRMNEDLNSLEDLIHDLTPVKQQIQMDLAELLKLKAEKDQLDQDFVIVDIMKSIIQPGKGIQKELLNIYFFDIYNIANELLLNTFGGKLRLREFIITDKEFTIPFEFAGERGSDVSLASSSQRATIAIAISLAIISKLIDRYSIVTFDESDQTLSPANKAVFVEILSKQMKAVGIAQAFIISHSPEYYESLSNLAFIGFPGYKDSINVKANDVIEV